MLNRCNKRYCREHYKNGSSYEDWQMNLPPHLHHHHEEFRRIHRYLRWFRPSAFIITILIIFSVFRYAGIRPFPVIFAALFLFKEVYQFIIVYRLEKRIMKPIERLKAGVEQISRGNYEVEIESTVFNEVGVLINDFNLMARKLKEGEETKQNYEENRKALIANISHDLKTPITSVNGYIEAILDGVVTTPEKMQSYLRIIESNVTYMNKLIDDLFLYSKLDMDKLEFNYERTDVLAYLSDTMEEFKFMLSEQGIPLNFHDELGKVINVTIDRKRIYQAIRNIIGNAVKYGKKEELTIDVTIRETGDNVTIDIKDNGPGIAQEKLPHIFERFYRVDTERTKDEMSTGLGLAIAHEILEAHKGSISAVSDVGKGSIFTIMLPKTQQ